MAMAAEASVGARRCSPRKQKRAQAYTPAGPSDGATGPPRIMNAGAPAKRSKTQDPVGSLLVLRDPEPEPAMREKAAKCACYAIVPLAVIWFYWFHWSLRHCSCTAAAQSSAAAHGSPASSRGVTMNCEATRRMAVRSPAPSAVLLLAQGGSRDRGLRFSSRSSCGSASAGNSGARIGAPISIASMFCCLRTTSLDQLEP